MTDGIEAILPILLPFVSLGAFELGMRVREHVHVIMPYKDPVTVLLVLVCLSPVISQWFGYTFIEPSNIWYVAAVIAFLSCYTLAYIRGELGMVYVNVHTIVSEQFPGGAQQVKPIVYYWDNDGKQYLQEQGIWQIIKAVVFKVKSPLRLDTGTIRRTRPLFVQKVLFPSISVEAIDVVEEKVTVSEVKRWIFRFKVRSYVYTPAPSCIDSTQQWLVSAYNQKALTQELTRKEAQLLEEKTSSRSEFIAKSADLLVELIADKTPGSEVHEDMIERLAPEENTDEDEFTEPKRKSVKRTPLRRNGILSRKKRDADE